MRTRTLYGTLLMLGILGLVAVSAHAQAAAFYAGSKLCVMCHKKTNGPAVDAYLKSPHASAMMAASDEVIVADFGGAPFKRDQVAWVLCSGRSEQAYLDKDLKVLPGLWKSREKKWVATESVDAVTECLGCHTTGLDVATRSWKELAVGCERCHGAGKKHSTAKPDDRKSTIVNLKNLAPAQQAMTCGQCHSQGRSKDGKLAFPAEFQPGDDLAARFTDAKPNEPGRNQQFSDLIRSPKHWDKGVVCETCHDPHGDTGQPHLLKLSINDTCLQCHKDRVESLEKHVAAKGKPAPADATCATCHMPGGRHLFDKTLADK